MSYYSLDVHLSLLLSLRHILCEFYHNHCHNIAYHLMWQSPSNECAQPRIHAWVPDSYVLLNRSTWVSRKPLKYSMSTLHASSPAPLLLLLFMFYWMRAPPSLKPKPQRCPWLLPLSHYVLFVLTLTLPLETSSTGTTSVQVPALFQMGDCNRLLIHLLTCSLSLLQSSPSIDIRVKSLNVNQILLLRLLGGSQKLQVVMHTS